MQCFVSLTEIKRHRVLVKSEHVVRYEDVQGVKRRAYICIIQVGDVMTLWVLLSSKQLM